MSRELSDVFKSKTRADKRKVLDKFDISKEDKNKFLNGIESGSGESSTTQYIDIRGYDIASYSNTLFCAASIIKLRFNNQIYIFPTMYVIAGGDFNPQEAELLAIGIDTNLKSIGAYGDLLDPLEWAYKQYGGDLRNYPRITKEQFYSLE